MTLEKYAHGSSPELPQSGIRLVVNLDCRLPQQFQPLKQGGIATAQQPFVKKYMGYRQNNRTVDIVLHLLEGLIAHPHRPHATITG